MMRRLRLFPLLCLLISATACSNLLEESEESDVLLVTDRTEYVHGDTMEVQFINNSDESVGYGACSRSLERRIGGEWRPVFDEPQACIMILYVLKPGERRIERQPVDATLPAGTYRLRQRIMPGTNLPEKSIFSPVLTIRASS
jgi:hypothetical protein